MHDTIDAMVLYFYDRDTHKPQKTGQYMCLNDRGSFYVICYDAQNFQWFYDATDRIKYFDLNCVKWAAIPRSLKTGKLQQDVPQWLTSKPQYEHDLQQRLGNGG